MRKVCAELSVGNSGEVGLRDFLALENLLWLEPEGGAGGGNGTARHDDDTMDAILAHTRKRGQELGIEVLIAREGGVFEL